MKNNKAQTKEMFYFLFFYVIMTSVIVLALILIPRNIMEKSLDPVALDEMVLAKQIESRLWEKDTITGISNPFKYTANIEYASNITTKKQLAFRLKIGQKETYFNKNYYLFAEPIAIFKFEKYYQNKTVFTEQGKELLEIEEYYPKKYENYQKI